MAKLTHYALLVTVKKPKYRESTQMKLEAGRSLHADDMTQSPDKIKKLVTLHAGNHASSWLRDQALNYQTDLTLTDTNTITEVQEVWDAGSAYNQFVVRQTHRFTGIWQVSTFYRLVELAPTAAALMIELEELRELKGLVDR